MMAYLHPVILRTILDIYFSMGSLHSFAINCDKETTEAYALLYATWDPSLSHRY